MLCVTEPENLALKLHGEQISILLCLSPFYKDL